MRLALLAALGASALLAASGASEPPPEGAVGAFLAAKAKARADAAAAAAAQATVAGGAASVDATGASAFGDAYDLYAAGYDDDDLWDEEDHPDVRDGRRGRESTRVLAPHLKTRAKPAPRPRLFSPHLLSLVSIHT